MRSLSEALGWGRAARPALAGVAVAAPPPKTLLRGERSARGVLRWRLPLERPPSIGVEIALTLAVLVGAAAFGAARGGHLDDFVARHGGLGDVVARTLGFGVDVVTMSGATHLSEARDPGRRRHQLQGLAAVLRRGRGARAAGGRSARQAGERAQALSEPDRHRHRRAHALRRSGRRTARFMPSPPTERRSTTCMTAGTSTCPLSSARAPTCAFASSRRFSKPWTNSSRGSRRACWSTSVAGISKLKSGVEIKLPEDDPQAAIATLLRLQRQSRLLERDVLALDLRAPGRVFVRLSEEAAAAWAERSRAEEGGAAMSFRALPPRMRQIPARKSAILSVLDVGASKIVCLIARLTPMERSEALRGRTHRCKVLGIGHQRSSGVKGGAVVDLQAAEHAVRLAVDAAERMAGVEVGGVIVNMSGGLLGSQRFSARAALRSRTVSEHDIHRVLEAASAAERASGTHGPACAADRFLARRDARRARSQGHDRRGARRRPPRRLLRPGCGAQSDAGRRAMPSARRGDGGDALCGGTVDARRR